MKHPLLIAAGVSLVGTVAVVAGIGVWLAIEVALIARRNGGNQ